MSSERPADADGPPVNSVLQLATRIGDALLSAGMSANDVVVVILRITRAYGLTAVHVDVTYTAIAVSYYPGIGADPVTAIRVVRPDIIDYSEVRELNGLSRDIQAGLPIGRALEALQRIRSAGHPYPAWVATAGNAGVAAGVSLLFTTSWKIVLITFLTGCVVDRALAVMDNRRVPPFFQNVAAAVMITMIAAAIKVAAVHGVRFFAGLNSTLIVVGGIVMLVAGMMIVGAVQDAIDQFYVTASARVFEVAMRTAGIVIGIAIALQLTQRLGLPLSISLNPVPLGPTGAQFAGATLTAASYALWAYADATTIGLCAAMGLLGWAGYTAMIQAGAGEVAANTAGALAAALTAALIVRRTNVPGFALVSAALLPLVPGLALYNGLIEVVGTAPGNADTSKGGRTLFMALAVALGIAAGASLGTYLGRPIADQLRRFRIRVHHRRDRRSEPAATSALGR